MSDYIKREDAINAFYTATGDGDKAEWCVGVIQSIPAADVVERPRWIPVMERLPDEHQPVLAYCADDDFYYISRMHKSFEDYDIDYWMPITEPPKEVDA